MTGAALEVLDSVASALKEASKNASSVVGGALGSLAAVAGPAMHDAGGLAGDLLADHRARKEPFKAREVSYCELMRQQRFYTSFESVWIEFFVLAHLNLMELVNS